MAKMNKIMPPRNTTIRGQDHLLAYITPEEAEMLMANGGSGKPGPMGIPAFDDADEIGDAIAEAVAFSDEGAGYDYSDFYAEAPSKSGGPSDYSLVGTEPPENQYDKNVAALEQLNKDLYDLSRRQERAKSLPSKLGLLAGKNINNIAAALVGYPPDLLSSINPFSDNKIGSGLAPETLAGLQSRGIRGASGQITGVTDEFGNVVYGVDPNENYDGDGGFEPEVKPVDPETGQCDEGYMFDEDMQACRLAPVAMAERQVADGGAYARMGLLDQTPTGLPQFQQQYGVGFGTPSQFADANMAFRRRGAYEPANFQRPYPTDGYTLLG